MIIVKKKIIRVQIPDFFEIGIPTKKETDNYDNPDYNAYDNPRYHALVNLRWVFNCWAAGIIGSPTTGGYGKGAIRRVETFTKIQTIFNELKPHLTEEEWYQLRKGLLNEDGVAFDLE